MMRLPSIVSAIVLCLGVSGCRLASDITHNVVFETCLFVDEVKGKVYYRMLANAAWKEYLSGHADCAGGTDFAKGFKLGYADYLESGGDGAAHPLPPLRYWKIRHETPEGRAATVAWLKGYREGAAAAHASGYRQLIIVPVGHGGGPPPGSPPPLSSGPLLGDAPAGPATLLPPVEELPGPRTIPAPLPLTPNPSPRRGEGSRLLPSPLGGEGSGVKGGGDKAPAGTLLKPTSYCPNKPERFAKSYGD